MLTYILIGSILCFKLSSSQLSVISDNDKIHFGKKVVIQTFVNTDVDHIIRHVVTTDIESCINECKRRPNCYTINYNRHSQLCYIIRPNQTSEITDFQVSPGFIYGNKNDWNTNTNCNSCALTETCNQTTGYTQCQIQECGKPPDEPNALYKGNMRSIGSNIAYYCTNDTVMSNQTIYISECQSDGQWSPTNFTCAEFNLCESGPCLNGAVCTNAVGFYICNCTEGWGGTNCDIDIDECASSPCLHGQCVDVLNGYTCTCDAGWEGTLCDTDIDECFDNPCLNQGTCTDQLAGFTCACAAGWQGAVCDTNIDECASNPCQNGQCNDIVNGYTCTCDAGWTGTLCDTNIDECVSNECQHGQCIDGINGYNCTCDAGWTGTLCDTRICLAGWTHYDSSCYKIFDSLVNYAVAQGACTTSSAGHLADVTSSSEMDFLMTLYYNSGLSNTDFWISTNDQQSEGVYKLSDNTETNYFNWDPNGQPDQEFPEDDCVQVWVNTNFKWNDVRCDYVYWYCCEYEI